MADSIATVANLATAEAMYQAGHSTRSVAKALGISPYSAWALKRREKADPELVQHVSKQISDKMLLASSLAVDTVLEKAFDDELKNERAIDLAKISHILLNSAANYAALSGSQNLMTNVMDQYGIASSHSSSRVTVEQRITVEKAKAEPLHIDIEGKETA